MGFGKDGMGVILKQSISSTLGTLDSDTALFITAKPALLERFRMLKSEVMVLIEGLTTGDGGGLSLWLADGDLSVTEVEEAIEGNGPLGPNDTVIAAISDRFVMWVGATVNRGSNVEQGMIGRDSGSPLCVVKPRWTFGRTKSWNFVVYNLGAQLTTGSTLNLRVKNFGIWVT